MTQDKPKSKYAIIMISIGDRPWVRYTRRTFEAYCRRHGYDFYLITDRSAFEDMRLKGLDEQMGRRNKDVYAAKIFLPWKYMTLHGYERVALADDSCTIMPSMPPIFELVPVGKFGGPEGRELEARQCFNFIQSDPSVKSLEHYQPERYLTPRLMVYDESLADLIGPKRLCDISGLLDAKLPASAVLYYWCCIASRKPYRFPDGTHRLPGWYLPNPQRKSMRNPFAVDLSAASLWDVTSGYWNRRVMASGLAVRANYLWDSAERGKIRASIRFGADITRVLAADIFRSLKPAALEKKARTAFRNLR